MNARKSNIFGIRHNKTYVNLFVFFSFLALSFMISRFFSPIIESNASDISTDIVVNPTASVTLSTNTLNFTIIPNESGVFDSDSVVATVDTNSTGGYELYFSSVDNNTSMVNVDSNVSDVISSDFNDTVTSSTMLSNKWGYSLDNTNYLKIPTLSNHLILKNINHLPEAEEKNSTVYIGTKIDSNINAGIYQKDIKFTALAHASLPIPTYTITWDMNDGTANPSGVYVESLIKGRTIDLTNLTPERENYTFAGWSNGTTTFEGNETEANINPNNLDSITMTAQWTANCTENCTEVNLAVGESMGYDYTGQVVGATLKKAGYYKLEVWGAQGGNSGQYNGTYGRGGYGGYARGTVYKASNEVLYVVVGGAGQSDTNTTSYGYFLAGGYNGGGRGRNGDNRDTTNPGGGGGATDITTSSPVFTDNAYISGGIRDNISLNNRIIVAGGGGAAGYHVITETSNGGSGGGYIGGEPQSKRTNNESYAGTQTEASSITDSSCLQTARIGIMPSFGYGVGASDSTDVMPGGGGGWYGGHGMCDAAAGGSGYINTSVLQNAIMYMYDNTFSNYTRCKSSTDVATKTTCTTNTGAHISEYANTGNGYAKITYLGTSI